jgi:chromosome segregation ATPase
MGQKEIKKAIFNLEEEIKALHKKKAGVENEGCFSDKEIKEKRERLNELNEVIRSLSQEIEGLKKRLRLGTD